jgi:hypothetical protein
VALSWCTALRWQRIRSAGRRCVAAAALAARSGRGDPVAILAAGEALLGPLIEISFIATFTQRFFGAK